MDPHVCAAMMAQGSPLGSRTDYADATRHANMMATNLYLEQRRNLYHEQSQLVVGESAPAMGINSAVPLSYRRPVPTVCLGDTEKYRFEPSCGL